ncbi:MAG: prefoldin subunit alpha [Promethearchaeota archaeon]
MQDPSRAQSQAIYQFQFLRQQQEMLENQLNIINVSLQNLMTTKTTLENLNDVKDGQEILIPVGGLINLKGTIGDTKKVLLYISQDVVVEKNIDDAINFINKLIEQHREQLNYTSNQLKQTESALQNLAMAMQQASMGRGPPVPPK